MKINNNLKVKLEEIFKQFGYKIRYEKGQFNSGFCIMEDQKVVVINKFFPLESKVNALMSILQTIHEDRHQLDDGDLVKLYDKIQQTTLLS